MMYSFNFVNQYPFKQTPAMPVYSYPPMNYYTPGPNAKLYAMILFYSLIVFVAWDLLLVLGNYQTIFHLFSLHNVFLGKLRKNRQL